MCTAAEPARYMCTLCTRSFAHEYALHDHMKWSHRGHGDKSKGKKKKVADVVTKTKQRVSVASSKAGSAEDDVGWVGSKQKQGESAGKGEVHYR